MWRRPDHPAHLFDANWYLTRYPHVRRFGSRPLRHYLREGAKAGLQPHPLFDGARYLQLYPDVAAAGLNPLVHYLGFGWREGRSPHLLFDTERYLRLYPDVAAAGLNPLIHYIHFGWHEGRSPHSLFDTNWYRATYLDADAGGDANPLVDFIETGAANGRQPHPLFDAIWYVTSYPELGLEPAAALPHYMEAGWQQGRNPGPFFDCAWYLDAYPDVGQAAINPLIHYLESGRKQGRFPVDPESDVARSGVHPYKLIGQVGNVFDFVDRTFDQQSAQRVNGYFAKYGLSSSGRRALPLNGEEIESWIRDINEVEPPAPPIDPDVSIVIPVFNEIAHTLACIHSLLEMRSKRSFEIIVGDDASTDETAAALKRLASVRHVRSETNRGFIANCNAAAAESRGRHVAFLNNDTIVLPGWLDEMVDTLERDRTIGLVGSKLIFADGRLQEAGGIIWRDGSAWNYGRGQDPNRPEFSYLRDVDYVSGASIMLPTALWRELGGFDPWYDVAYGEDSDLAFRVRAAGRRVVLQPLSMLLHFEGVSSGTDTSTGVKAYQLSNAQKLFERWQSVMANHRPNGVEPHLERERAITKRILVLDAVTPTPDEDAGSLTCVELMRAFQVNGFKVTFMPWSNLLFMPKHTRALQRIGIEAVYLPYYASQESYLRQMGNLFDIILLFRNEVSFPAIQLITKYAPDAKILYHVSDLHFLREERQAALEGADASRVRRTQAREIYSAIASDMTIVHSEHEKQVLAEKAPDAKVYVFPWIVDTKPVEKGFEQRSGVAFLGGYGHPPNVDAVLYFAARIWPKIHARRPDIVFYIYGSRAPKELEELDGKMNIRYVGHIEDLEECFGNIRVSVAPLRYGAGLKGKVAMAMAYGVPVVATSCAAEGMVLTEGENVLVHDDDEAFAEAVLRLYDSKELWERLSKAGLSYIEQGYSTRKGIARVGEIVSMVMGSPRTNGASDKL